MDPLAHVETLASGKSKAQVGMLCLMSLQLVSMSL
jgi:hypothetical protein